MTDIDFLNTLPELSSFMEHEICNERTLKKLKQLNGKHFEKLLNILCNQRSIGSFRPYYSIYKINIQDEQFSHHIDIDSELDEREFHTTIQSELNYLLLHTLSIESLVEYLTNNLSEGKKYVFIPLSFSSEYDEYLHMSCLIFDIINNKVYLYDPNGRSTYFNDIVIDAFIKNNKMKKEELDKELMRELYIETSDLVDKLMEGYLNEINKVFNVKYTFISSRTWNKYNRVINKSFNNSVIGSGHCVITTIMLLHYLSLTEDELKIVFENITKLNDEELIYIINCYSNWMYNNIICNFN